jgi:hypothetical protein
MHRFSAQAAAQIKSLDLHFIELQNFIVDTSAADSRGRWVLTNGFTVYIELPQQINTQVLACSA